MEGVSPTHRLAVAIEAALLAPAFAAQWTDPADETFRAFAVAALDLGDATRGDDPARAALIHDIATRRRAELLAELLGRPVTVRAIRWLGRVDWQEMERGDWETLFGIAAAAPPAAALGHVRRITPLLLRQYEWIPEAVRAVGLLDVASALAVPHARWQRIRDALEAADAGFRADLVRSAGSVASNGAFWDFYYRCDGRYSRPFDLPLAFTASALLEPIATPAALDAEATRMQNCLATRASRVHSGNRVYFRLREGGVDAELVRQGGRWVPGDILGFGNAAVSAKAAGRVRAELQRLAELAGPEAGVGAGVAEDAFVEMLGERVRRDAAEPEIAGLRAALQRIRGRSRSWTDGAYAIFQVAGGPYVQFMSSPDGTEYLIELASHRYLEAVHPFLTAEAVDLIERAGFVWPTAKANFIRWATVASDADVGKLADFALALLVRVFRHRTRDYVDIRTHVPA
jgi:hypothetical protein